MRAGVLLTLAAFTIGVTSEASAQPRERVFISINGAFQATRNPFTDRFGFEVSRETTGSTETQYPVDGDLLIDGSVAVRLWKNIGAGLGVSQFTRDDVASTDSRVPHPFHFEMPREISGDTAATRAERGVHLQGVYRFGFGRSVAVLLAGGPSFLRVEQDVVTSIQYDESYPYDTATFRGAETRRVTGSAVGVNAGADVAWMFTRHVGVGGAARFAKATIDLVLPGGRSKAVDAGGLSGGAGVRMAF